MSSSDTEAADLLQQKLDDPRIASALVRLLDRVEDLERVTDSIVDIAETMPGMVATSADIVDEVVRNAEASGIDVEARGQALFKLFVRFTEPENIEAMSKLVGRLPQLESASSMLETMPNLVAMVGDILDEHAKQISDTGINVEQAITQAIHTVLWLSSRISDRELDRLGFLLRSHMLDEHALQVAGDAAMALAKCQSESCELQTPDRVSLLGMIRSLSDPDIQRSVGFALRFARCFGRQQSNGKSQD